MLWDWSRGGDALSRPRDAELMRRIAAVLEGVAGLFHEDIEYLEVERRLLVDLHAYVEELKAR
jgi:hypothetical protein